MTDLRQRLADALREHQLGYSTDERIHCCVSIGCDWTGHNLDFEEHQAVYPNVFFAPMNYPGNA